MNEDTINMLVSRIKELEKEVVMYEEHLNSSCLKSLKVGEPFFVLKGTDQTAPSTLLFWVGKNIGRLGDSHPKIISAM